MSSEHNLEVWGSGNKGKGLYTTSAIRSGEGVVTAFGLVVPNNRVHLPPYESIGDTICFQIDVKHHLCPISSNPDRWSKPFFVNRITLVAMRDINPSEEITFDYCMTDADFPGMGCHPNILMDCLCGSLNCRRVITGDDWRRPDLQRKYRGYFSDYIQGMIDKTNSEKELPTTIR